LFGVTTTLYVWRPSIAADMVWFLRRFLPVTIPGLILFSMVLTQELIRHRHPIAKVGVVFLIVGGLALPLALLPHYVFQRSYGSLGNGLDQTCTRLGTGAAIVVVQSSGVVEGPQYRYPQALQAFCQVPVAPAPPGLLPAFYETLAAQWKQRGRRLQLVADLPQALTAAPGGAHVLQQSSYRVLERTLNRQPTEYKLAKLILFVKTVPVAAGT
jgi:hypothetical protein